MTVATNLSRWSHAHGKRHGEKNPADRSLRTPAGPQVNAASGDIKVENLQRTKWTYRT